MSAIIRNPHLVSYFQKAALENKFAGCYIVEGAEGTGKLEITLKAAASLICSSPKTDGAPCLRCSQCTNVMEGGHGDVTRLSPESEGKSIPIAQVREMIEKTHLSPTQSDYRIFIIEQAHKLKKDAQNALLKSIEEPLPNTVFFLLTEDLTALLPTVRSRAVKLKTKPLSPDEIYKELLRLGVNETEAKDVSLLSGGSLGKAKKILGDKDHHQVREMVISYFAALMDGAGFTKLCTILSPSGLSRSDLSVILPMIKSALRDLICYGTKSFSAEFFSDRDFLRDLSEIISVKIALELFALAEKLELSLMQNANLFSSLSGFHLTAQKLTRS